MTRQRSDYCDEAGGWSLWRRSPRRELLPFVHEIQGYRESGGLRLVRDERPNGLLPLILLLESGFELADEGHPGGWRGLDRSFIAGVHGHPARVASGGSAVCPQVNSTPLGARRFLRHDLDGLTD